MDVTEREGFSFAAVSLYVYNPHQDTVSAFSDGHSQLGMVTMGEGRDGG